MTGTVKRHIVLGDADATERLGAGLARVLRPGAVILLEGPLGAGKTTLVRGLVRGLGGDPAEVHSPTFTLLETYEVCGGVIRRLHHADLYRLRGPSHAPWDEIGLGEALDDREAVTAVEWPEAWGWLGGTGDLVVRVSLAFRADGREATVRLEESLP